MPCVKGGFTFLAALTFSAGFVIISSMTNKNFARCADEEITLHYCTDSFAVMVFS